MTTDSLTGLVGQLAELRDVVSRWLRLQQVRDLPFGHFRTCTHAFEPDELDAATAGIELWVMLGLPISDQERDEAVHHLRAHQRADNGLVFDATWRGRKIGGGSPPEAGDTFFTMTTCESLNALNAHFQYPIAYLAALTAEELISKTSMQRSALSPFALGDYAALVAHNCQLEIPGALQQWHAVLDVLVHEQDEATGLWPRGSIESPYTPAINRAFHFLRSTWNLAGHAYSHADHMIDTCLRAADDSEFYDWSHRDACNDLDLAFVLYCAAKWQRHRLDEIGDWARRRLPTMLRIQKPDGGFSYTPERAMRQHNAISMSPGLPEGDLWGTLMYLGAIKMMVELAYPGVSAPWGFSEVHRPPCSSNATRHLLPRIPQMPDPPSRVGGPWVVS